MLIYLPTISTKKTNFNNMEKTTQAPGYAPTATAQQAFNELAKSFNLYTLENLPKILFETQTIGDSFSVNYTDKINSAKIDLPSDILTDFKPVLLFEVRNQYENGTNKIELVYVEHEYTAFCTPAGNIAIMRHDWRAKKHHFMPHYSHYRGVQNVSHYKREQYKKDNPNPQPQNIGVFTHKKVAAWLQWCDVEIAANKAIVEQANGKNAQIVAEIKDFINKSGGRVSTWHDCTEVEAGLFTVKFEHNKAAQYLRTEIRFKGGLNDILNIVSK